MIRQLLIAMLLLAACSDPATEPVPRIDVDLGHGGMPDVASEPDLAELEVDSGPDLPGEVGAACEDADDCVAQTCLSGAGFPGGYCTIDGCDGGCVAGSFCSYSEEFGIFCAAECDQQNPCRDGYSCRAQGVPADLHRLCTPIRGSSDGEPCTDRTDCEGGTCLPWAGGYCTTNRCDTNFDCASLGGEDNRCVDDGEGGICLRACDDVTDCRAGYLCEDIGLPTSFCINDPSRPFTDTVFGAGPLGITCGVPVTAGIATFTYDIAPTTTSYMVVPMARDGSTVDPRRIRLPDQTDRNFNLSRAFMKTSSVALGSMSPMLIPPGPDYTDLLAAGQNSFTLATEATEVCYYVLEKDTEGAVLDVNLHLVGVPGLTAANALANTDVADVLAEFSRIYEQIGVTIGTVRTVDVAPDIAQRFALLAGEGDLDDLLKTSAAPGSTLDESRSVNVFMVAQITIPGEVVGLSPAQPGPAGLHGTHGSGVVISAEYMGGPAEDTFGEPADGNTYTALILAHEMGHWLGLGHTTEPGGQIHDHLADTPECANPIDAEGCGDWGNVMFPYARAGSSALTADQGWVIRANPVVRP